MDLDRPQKSWTPQERAGGEVNVSAVRRDEPVTFWLSINAHISDGSKHLVQELKASNKNEILPQKSTIDLQKIQL